MQALKTVVGREEGLEKKKKGTKTEIKPCSACFSESLLSAR